MCTCVFHGPCTCVVAKLLGLWPSVPGAPGTVSALSPSPADFWPVLAPDPLLLLGPSQKDRLWTWVQNSTSLPGPSTGSACHPHMPGFTGHCPVLPSVLLELLSPSVHSTFLGAQPGPACSPRSLTPPCPPCTHFDATSSWNTPHAKSSRLRVRQTYLSAPRFSPSIPRTY